MSKASNKVNALPPITNENYPKVLFLGNGINQCFDMDSWEGVLKALKEHFHTKEYDPKEMPFPLQAILLSKNKVNEAAKIVAKNLVDMEPGPDQKEMLQRLLHLKFDAIITTNYSYELEKTLVENWDANRDNRKYRKHMPGRNRAENRNSLYTYYQYQNQETPVNIWHIHGEARKHSSIVLGHDYYGNLIGKYGQYIERQQFYRKGIPTHEIKMGSWIDMFLLGEVHVLGFGFDYSEIDLWWLLNKKASLAREHGKTYFYDLAPSSKLFEEKCSPEQKKNQHDLMDVLGVNVKPYDAETYLDAYQYFIKKLQTMEGYE